MMTPLRLLPLTLFLAACGGEGGGGTTPGPVLAIAVAGGNGQTDTVAQVLAVPLQVLVSADGAPDAGHVVRFQPTSGSGSVSAVFDTTGADGVATTTWTLGTTAGGRALNATLFGTVVGPAQFTATALPGPATTFTAFDGDGQIQAIDLVFPASLQVRIRDQFGNGLPGLTVSWAVPGGGVQLGNGASVTGAEGRAAVGITAGPAPAVANVLATVGVLPDTVAFVLRVTPSVTSVNVSSNFFQPAAITIPQGGAVRWVWTNGSHDVSSNGGPVAFGMSAVQGSGATFGPIVFDTPGVYPYECTLHVGMTGSITVQ